MKFALTSGTDRYDHVGAHTIPTHAPHALQARSITQEPRRSVKNHSQPAYHARERFTCLYYTF